MVAQPWQTVAMALGSEALQKRTATHTYHETTRLGKLIF
jgi:hypothetical protein